MPVQTALSDAATHNADLSREVRGADRAIDHNLHLLRLADAMTYGGQKAQDWSYHGYSDGGPASQERCTCSHPIRHIFWIKNSVTGSLLKIGSTCIETSVPYLIAQGAEHLATALQEAVRKLLEALAEAKRRERDAANDVLARAMISYARDLEAWRVATRRSIRLGGPLRGRYWMPDFLYKPFKINVNSTPGRTVSGARKKITRFLTDGIVAARKRDDNVFKSYPIPPEEVRDMLRESTRAELAKRAEEERKAKERSEQWERERKERLRRHNERLGVMAS